MWRWGRIDECPPAHSLATQMAFDRIVEQPTESSLTWACRQARMCPSPGVMPAHRDLTSTVQSRSEVNNPSCALAPTEPVSSNAAPSATVVKRCLHVASPFSLMTYTAPTLRYPSYLRISPPI